MPGTNLVVVDHISRAARAVRRVRPRTGAYILMGLAVSGWMGFLVLAGVLLAIKASTAALPEAAPPGPPMVALEQQHVDHKLVTPPPPEPAVGPEPAVPPEPRLSRSSSAYDLKLYEERRRVQERMRNADVADHDEGNVSAARSFYEYAAARGWAQAALALALSHDPNELRRRDVTVAADAAKARACYIEARELMDAAVTFYLSRLPAGEREERC